MFWVLWCSVFVYPPVLNNIAPERLAQGLPFRQSGIAIMVESDSPKVFAMILHSFCAYVHISPCVLTTFQLWTVFSRFFLSCMFWYVFCQCDLEKTLNTLRSLLGEFKVREHIRLTSERARGMMQWWFRWCNWTGVLTGKNVWIGA